MPKNNWKMILFIALILILFSCTKNDKSSEANADEALQKNAIVDSSNAKAKPKVTFIELGSVNCVPCRMMQPVMKAVEKEFGDQLEVIFYDVWKDPAPAQKYGIKLIPTQIYLDASGDEFFRHEGFFAKEAIEELLTNRGLKILEHVDLN